MIYAIKCDTMAKKNRNEIDGYLGKVAVYGGSGRIKPAIPKDWLNDYVIVVRLSKEEIKQILEE